jgi:DNA-directed RNA polymerase specialized sigma subunit
MVLASNGGGRTALIQLINPYICRDYNKVSFSPEQEEAICKVVPKDAIARLELVKTCMELVVKFANWYASESGKPFNQLVQAGVLAVVRSAENFSNSKESSFNDYISQEIMRAMSSSPKSNL